MKENFKEVINRDAAETNRGALRRRMSESPTVNDDPDVLGILLFVYRRPQARRRRPCRRRSVHAWFRFVPTDQNSLLLLCSA